MMHIDQFIDRKKIESDTAKVVRFANKLESFHKTKAGSLIPERLFVFAIKVYFNIVF